MAPSRSAKDEGLKEAEKRIRLCRENGERILHLDALALTELPESLLEIPHLEALVAQNNRLNRLPDWFRKLSNLTVLFLGHNQLGMLPEWLGELRNLRDLQLQFNKLTALPESVGRLSSLVWLDVRRNKLTALPDTMGQLQRLKQLLVSHNRLTILPASLYRLTELQELRLEGNKALGLPPEALKSDEPIRVLDYYFRVSADRRPLNEAKLILVGRGGVGKTSLVNRLLHDYFNKGEKKTEGICISEWSLRLLGKDDVRLNLWDFGGQEIMHATHQFFLTQRSLYVLVLEGRQGAEDADAEYWLKLIESFGTEGTGDESPVLVVLNKIRETPFDLNRRALGQKYPFIRDFIVTDCADGTGIAELRAAIERETNALKHLRADFPASWFAVKEQLAGMKEKLRRSYVSFEEYREICTKHGEKEPGAQESLAAHLHNLGIALNYKDDPRLRDTHVLDPHWVTTGIYKILNAPLLAEQKGELRLEDAARLLDTTEYPRSMHRFLFDLMKKFQLCFAFPDDEEHYLIPQLLDKQEVVETAKFRPAECLNFEYRYPILPEGLLPRFIVRTHALSVGLPRWRSGVVLAFEGARALVKADVEDKRVFIHVSGPPVGRRQLLGIIRCDFERIHSSISRLRPEAFVPVPNRPEMAIPYEKLLTFESKKIAAFPEVVGGDVLQLDVQALLNGVDLEGTRYRETDALKEQPLRLFYSYSHKDTAFRDELETHLKLLQRRRLIDDWNERNIEVGTDWKARLEEHLHRADIILILVSVDMFSDNCWDNELMKALKRHAAGEAKVIPILVRNANYSGAPFDGIKPLPDDGVPVAKWPSRDDAWANISKGIERAVCDLRDERRSGRRSV